MTSIDRSARAGIAVALLALLAALAALLVVVRATPVAWVSAVGEPAAAASPAFMETVAAAVPVGVDSGTVAWLLADGDGTFPRLLADLQGARRSITFHVYFWRPGRLSDAIVAALAERARAGVRVLVLVDDVGSSGDEAVQRALRDAGAEVAVLRPVPTLSIRRAQFRSHLRAVVIDGATAYTGGFGIADEWLGRGAAPDEWRETNVRVRGPGALQVQGGFAALWAEATGRMLAGDAFFPPLRDTGAAPDRVPAGAGGGVTAPADDGMRLARSGVAFTVPTGGSTGAERLVALTLAAATERLYIANAYFVPDAEFRRLLIDAASRGVDVRVLIAGERTDVPITRLAALHVAGELIEGGVRIWEYEPSMMHAKTIVADGVFAQVGSMNFDNRSLAMNEEITLIAQDSAFGRALERMFLDDLTRSRELTLEQLRGRGAWQRLKQRGAHAVAELL